MFDTRKDVPFAEREMIEDASGLPFDDVSLEDVNEFMTGLERFADEQDFIRSLEGMD
jgi:hypothetical protein